MMSNRSSKLTINNQQSSIINALRALVTYGLRRSPDCLDGAKRSQSEINASGGAVSSLGLIDD